MVPSVRASSDAHGALCAVKSLHAPSTHSHTQRSHGHSPLSLHAPSTHSHAQRSLSPGYGHTAWPGPRLPPAPAEAPRPVDRPRAPGVGTRVRPESDPHTTRGTPSQHNVPAPTKPRRGVVSRVATCHQWGTSVPRSSRRSRSPVRTLRSSLRSAKKSLWQTTMVVGGRL